MELLITDLTYMKTGICIAGLKTNNLEVVRPVLKHGQMQKDFALANNLIPYSLVDIELLKKVPPNPPHTEDWYFDRESIKFISFMKSDDWFATIDKVSFTSLKKSFDNLIVENKGVVPGSGTGSLVFLKKVEDPRVYFFGSREGKVLPFRMRFSFRNEGERFFLPVTDFQVLNYCKSGLEAGSSYDKLILGIEEMIEGSKKVYLRIGLGRPFKKDEKSQELCYLQVNGIYTDDLDKRIRLVK